MWDDDRERLTPFWGRAVTILLAFGSWAMLWGAFAFFSRLYHLRHGLPLP